MPTPRNFWRVVLPLGSSDDPRGIDQAFEAAAGLGQPFKKFLFVSRYEPDLDQVLDLILLNSTSLDLKGLYENPKIPWQAGEEGLKSFTFGGRIEPEDYHFAFITKPQYLTTFGDTEATFSVRPVTEGRHKNVYLIRYTQSWFMGPLNTKVWRDINREWLRLLDVSDDTYAGDSSAGDREIREHFAASFPEFSRTALPFIRMRSTVERIPSADGAGRLTRVNLVSVTDGDRLRREYPHLGKVHKVLSASHLQMKVKDPKGRDLLVIMTGGGEMGLTLITRDGLVFPMDPATGLPSPEGVRLDEALSQPHRIEIRNWIVAFGMKMGMEQLGFSVVREDDRRRGMVDGVPKPILPPIIKQILGPFIRSYYEVLYDGNNGQGMTFEGHFSPIDVKETANTLTHTYELPLQNSSLLSFFLKTFNQFRRSMPYEARQEFLSLIERLTQALASDFDRARACFAAPTPVLASAGAVSDPPCASPPHTAR
ncbi:MAG: hypothetical protein HYT87_09945 [Nitrospirae bacterium]|nr:hypothetical protein [Nitrospirota bacterium]